MADCHGDIPCSTKVDSSMRGFLEDEAERLGVTKAELHRRVLDFYRQSRKDETPCPHCAGDIDIQLRS
jgi:hypothetical protein